MDSRAIRIAAAVGGGLLILVIGFVLGRALAGGADGIAADTTTTTGFGDTTTVTSDEGTSTTSTLIEVDGQAMVLSDDVPEYGSEEDRQALLDALAEAGVGFGSASVNLALADRTCYDLERLQAQRQSVAFAVRVVWNESFAEAESEELAAFGVVFSAAPYYMCPESVEYANEVAYWMGF